jgi:uncharacterized protein with ATP-grasp and redox domains
MSVTPRTTIALPISKAEATRIARAVVLPPNEVARVELVNDLFGEDYVPGTFMLAERKESPAFLRYDDEENYENWIRAMTRSHMEALLRAKFVRSSMNIGFLRAIEDAILTVLDASLESGLTLCESMTNQQATDIVWRILKTLLTGNPYASYHVFREFNDLGHTYAMEILKRESPNDPILAFRHSIVAGALGIDIKAEYTAAGPSPLVDAAIIRLSTDQGKRTPDDLQREIDLRVAKTFGIDCCDDFPRDVLAKPGQVSLLFFTDDYIETVFDLWAIQTLLCSKHDLKVTIVPKWGQHANDASFDDIETLLNEPLFDCLNAVRSVRFHVAPNGPAGSGINAYELSPSILEALVSADVVVFKGARAYEMLQGIRKTVYFGFNVLHTYTETLTGLNATEGPSVLLRQETGVPSFDGFRARAQRKHTYSNGRVIGLARMTALEYVEAIRSQRYAQLVCESRSRDALNVAIMEQAKASGKTFAQVILEQGSIPPSFAM